MSAPQPGLTTGRISSFVEPSAIDASATWSVRVEISGEWFTVGRGHASDGRSALTAAQRVVARYKSTVGLVADSLDEFRGETISSELLTRLNARLHALAAILPQLGDAT